MVIELVRAHFGSCTFWFVFFMVCAHFGLCCFWFLLILVRAHFGLCCFWFVLFLVRAQVKKSGISSSKSGVILCIVQFYIGIHAYCRRTYCPSCSSKSSLPKSRRFLFLRVAIQESAIWCCFESQITCGVNR